MEKAKVSTKEVLADVRGGVTNDELMEKYGLSPKGLHSLATKLLNKGLITRSEFDGLVGSLVTTIVADPGKPKIRIDPQQVVQDIRSVQDDESIKSKYGLDGRGMHRLFTKLLDSGVMTRDELYQRNGTVAAEPKVSVNTDHKAQTSVWYEHISIAGIILALFFGAPAFVTPLYVSYKTQTPVAWFHPLLLANTLPCFTIFLCMLVRSFLPGLDGKRGFFTLLAGMFLGLGPATMVKSQGAHHTGDPVVLGIFVALGLIFLYFGFKRGTSKSPTGDTDPGSEVKGTKHTKTAAESRGGTSGHGKARLESESRSDRREPGKVKVPANAQHRDYADVPWYRRSGFNSFLVLAGFFCFPPLVWWCCLNLVTGDVYYNNYDKDGNLNKWSVANKVVAGIILALQVVGIGVLIYLK